MLPEESGQDVEIDVLQTEQFKESECSNCINFKLKNSETTETSQLPQEDTNAIVFSAGKGV